MTPTTDPRVPPSSPVASRPGTARFVIGLAFAALAAAIATSTLVVGQSAPPPAQDAAPVTYVKDVASILHQRCATCHRPGEIGPMPLLTYANVRPWAKAIRTEIAARRMPPWSADPHVGRFSNDPSLTARETDLINRWVAAGAPRGEGPEPAPPVFAQGWRIGKPDLTLSVAKPFAVPAAGAGEYQYFEIPTNLKEDRWVQAVEIRPSDPRVVHHALAFIRTPSGAVRPLTPGPDGLPCSDDACGDIEQHDARMGPIFAAIAVGTQPEVYPAGTAKLLPAGSILTLQVHYTPTGTATTDRTSVGLVFAKAPPTTPLRMVPLSKAGFVIPPRAANHAIDANLRFRKPVKIWSIGPHAHLRSKSWRFELESADGRKQPVLSVPRFDFNWQLVYRYAAPVPVAAGTRLHVVGVFDNSSANKANPDPNVEVRWGNMTTDEMLFASVVYSVEQ